MKRVFLLPSILVSISLVTTLAWAAVGKAQTENKTDVKTGAASSVPGVANMAPVVGSVESGSDDNSDFVMCRNQKVVRTIRIEKDAAERECVTFYTKSGVDKEVGRAKSKGNCARILANIRVNLDKAGWKCKDVDKVGFTSNAESAKTEE